MQENTLMLRAVRQPRLLLIAVLLAAATVAALLGARAAIGRADAGPTGPTEKTAWVARVTAAVDLHERPSDSSKVLTTVQPTTQWGGDSQLLVKDADRIDGDQWIDVRVLGRPNGRHGWVRADKVALKTTPYRIEVRRSTHTLTLYKSGRTLLRTKVVVGTKGTPTPAGYFSVGDKLELSDGKHFLGSWVLPLTAYSEVLHEFDGGPGQIALHGRGGASLNQPVGTAASHGCVRMDNRVIARIAALAPTGTPVIIS